MRRIVEKLHAEEDFARGLAGISTIAMLMVPSAHEHLQENAPLPTKERSRREISQSNKHKDSSGHVSRFKGFKKSKKRHSSE